VKAKRRKPAAGKAAARKNAAPNIDLAFDLPAKAKLKLPRAALIALLQKAWNEVPAKLRPELAACNTVAVDIHPVSDKQIAPMNWQFMQHEGPTDVLSFPLGEHDPERDAFHAGEIVVSYDTAKREASERGLRYEEEFARYCVHGFLHLLGYDDATPALRKKMFKVQEAALKDF
jgi:probable rRNA maturation factor